MIHPRVHAMLACVLVVIRSSVTFFCDIRSRSRLRYFTHRDTELKSSRTFVHEGYSWPFLIR
ncbi:hypothetical protein BDQ17DRAFT_1373219 [Cyathus striatus]|nr:hypothetical protein BDQ17DRAFT_1373219 [Cyathus striatus]